MSNLCRFCIMAAILDFKALKREKMAPYFFLMFISCFSRIRRVFAFTKKYTNFYFMTNEPTLCAVWPPNTFIVRSLTAQRVRFRSTGFPACIDQYRNYGSFQSTVQCRYDNPIQLRTKHYDAVHITQPFLGYHDTLCIQVSLFLHQISTYFYSVTLC